LRIGDDATRLERFAIALSIAGHAAWIMLLAAAVAGVAYGAPTAVASTAAAMGTVLVGFCLISVGDVRVGALVALAAVGLLVPFTVGWLAFGLGWAGAGIAMLRDPRLGRRLPTF
jgi:hypothetical protein